MPRARFWSSASKADATPAVESAAAEVEAEPRPSNVSDIHISEIQVVPARIAEEPQHQGPLAVPTAAYARPRRISFRSFSFFYGRDKRNIPIDMTTDEARTSTTEDERPATPTTPGLTPHPHSHHTTGVAPDAHLAASREKLRKIRKDVPHKPTSKVEKSALILRNIMLGAPTTTVTKAHAKRTTVATASEMRKVKAQLLEPKEANKLIAQLRTLPPPDGPSLPTAGPSTPGHVKRVVARSEGPIHAVCLDLPEAEAERIIFSRLAGTPTVPLTPATTGGESNPFEGPQEVNLASAEITSLVSVLRDLRIITLVSSPDLGFGQPPDGDGVLAGSVPSPETVSMGIKELTAQLLALGFATSKAVFPDHTGIYPPTDRMSVLTYWWGLEVLLPPPTMAYLANAKSVQNAALNFLTAFSLFSNGVREILPFVRYISQFLDFEWGAIKAQDKGQGVVCAATWVMPAAMVPRPWDFAPPPDKTASSALRRLTVDHHAPPVPPKPSGHRPGTPPPAPLTPPAAGDRSPTLAFPGSRTGPFVAPAGNPVLPPVMITPPTLPRHFAPKAT